LQVNAQHNQRTFHFTDQTVQKNVWQMFDEEKIPKYKQAKIRMRKAQELYNLTKDKTDYVWYTTRYERLLCLALRAPAQCDVVMSVLTVGDRMPVLQLQVGGRRHAVPPRHPSCARGQQPRPRLGGVCQQRLRR
jgi:hypothetical protein